MGAFALPANMPEDKAKALLSKAIHLSEGQREQCWREYLAANGRGDDPSPVAEEKGYAVNPLPWTAMGGGVDMTTVLQRVAAKEIDTAEAARLLASAGGLKIRHNPTGTISVKGNGRFPWASLYADQWEKVLAVAAEVTAYIALHREEIDAAEKINKAAKKAAA